MNELREYTPGECVGKALSVVIDHLFVFLALGILFGFASSFFETGLPLLVDSEDFSAGEWQKFSIKIGFGLVSGFFSAMFSAIACRLIASDFLGDREGRDVWRSAFSRLLPAIAVAFATGIATLFGLVLLVVPGIIVSLGFAFSEQAVMIEGLSPKAAMKRSWELTKGYRGKIFGLNAMLLLMTFLITFPLDFAADSIAKMEFLVSLGAMGKAIPATLSGLIKFLLLTPLFSVAGTILYLSARVSKEGLDLERLAAEFGEEGSGEARAESF